MAKSQGKSTAKTESTKRTHAYTVRYNEDEAALVEAAANGKALEVASWIRMVSIEAARAAKEGAGE